MTRDARQQALADLKAAIDARREAWLVKNPHLRPKWAELNRMAEAGLSHTPEFKRLFIVDLQRMGPPSEAEQEARRRVKGGGA